MNMIYNLSNTEFIILHIIFGIIFGCILQRSKVCFVAATTEPFTTNSTEQFRAILIGILATSLGFSIIKFLSHGELDMLGVYPISIALIIGAFLFGFGMVLSGCCSSGLFIRLGEGYIIHIFTFLGMIIGYFFASSHYQSIWGPFLLNAPAIFLPAEIGWTLGIMAHIIVIVLLYLVSLKLEKNAFSNNASKLTGAVLLGIFIVLHYIVLNSNWSVTGAFYWIEQLIAYFTGKSSIIAKQTVTLSNAIAPNLRNLGLLIGAFLSALISRKFNIKKIHSLKQVFTAIIGGLLMGYGTYIAGGCNISAFFIATASLSLSGWVFMICLFIGSSLGIKILYKIL